MKIFELLKLFGYYTRVQIWHYDQFVNKCIIIDDKISDLSVANIYDLENTKYRIRNIEVKAKHFISIELEVPDYFSYTKFPYIKESI